MSRPISFLLFASLMTLLAFQGCSRAPGGKPPPQVTPQLAASPTAAVPTRPGYPPTLATPAASQAGNPPEVSNLQTLTANVARYEKFEAQFDVQTRATHLDLPFDPHPPAGLQPGMGITVNALFSPDGWQTVYIQPAFQYQPYTHTLRGGKDHFTPLGAPRWAVRFAPQQPGDWQYRLYLEDAGGYAYYPPIEQPGLAFSVSETSGNPYTRRGFLRVSPTDQRYFEFQDGSPFIGLGFNEGFSQTDEVAARMQVYEQHGMTFFRVWLSGAGINGSQWTSWASHHLPNDGYLPGVHFDSQNTFAGADVSMVLDSANPCFFADFWQGGISVEPGVAYSLSARVKLSGVSGPVSSDDYGFVIKQGDWLGADCARPEPGRPLTEPVIGDTGWITVTGAYTAQEQQYWLDNLYLTLQNASAGSVYIDEVRVWRTDDPARVNLLREPNANSHLYFDPLNAARWDMFIQLAEQHGVYLKLVIDEKNEWLRNHLAADGKIVSQASNDNFYAAPDTKVRWLQEAWWRYLIARWGYSTAIHSFEYINEGDPYNGRHYEAANAMARYFDEHDPAQHMATTSFWAGFPNAEFWSNPAYPNIDYADLHAYISTGWGLTASFLSAERAETDPAHVYAGNASARLAAADSFDEAIVPRGLIIQGRGEWIVRYWMKAESFTADCPYNTTGGMQRIRWLVDGGRNAGGQEGVIPFNSEGKDFICTSPAGTFDWLQFSSDRDRDGNLLPTEYRLILPDDNPHTLALRIENHAGVAGTAWIDEVELVSPWGKVQPVIGQFDITPLNEDLAWFNHAYADVFGASALTGVQKPLVRGETGIDLPDRQEWDRDLPKDSEGVWLHNFVWGQISDGGMYDLLWWASETIPPELYDHFLTFQNFMAGIPLSNGRYRGVQFVTPNGCLRVWGQRDDVDGRLHLWIQNRQHVWKNIISGAAITPASGSITLPDIPAGQYRIEWWNPYAIADPIFLTQTLASEGALTLTLPAPLSDDVAVKIERLP
jgi:hypothetical protein